MPFGLSFQRKKRRPAPVAAPRHHGEQTQSPLFDKLPLELRQHIYRLALTLEGPILLHAGGPRPGQLVHARSALEHVRPLSLMHTCDRVYTEALPLLYAHNTFEIRNFQLMRSIANYRWTEWLRRLHLRWTILDPIGIQRKMRNHRRALEDVSHAAWTEVWNVLATCWSLCWLRVVLDVHSTAMPQFMAGEGELLAPLKSILTAPARGELLLTWPCKAPPGQSAEEMLNLWTVERELSCYNAFIANRRDN